MCVALSGLLVASCSAGAPSPTSGDATTVTAADGGVGASAGSSVTVTEDGRMLEPEGHQGVWFETEPEDPWEHLVWESQKYIGEPVDMPPYVNTEALSDIPEYPDLCSEEVMQRARELGLEAYNDADFRLINTCDFEYMYPGRELFGDSFSLTAYHADEPSGIAPFRSNESSYDSIPLVKAAGDDQFRCVFRGRINGGGHYGFVTVARNSSSDTVQCERVQLAATIFMNLGVLEGI